MVRSYLQRQHLQQLKAREQQVLRKLSGEAGEDEDGNKKGPTPRDVAFGIPLGGDRDVLVQKGLITPFGSSVSGEASSVAPSTEGEHATPSFDGDTSVTSSLTPGRSNGVNELAACHGPSSTAVGRLKTTSGEDESRSSTPGRLQLSSDSFDGLFSDLPLLPRARKKGQEEDVGKGKGKGKGKAKADPKALLEKTISSAAKGGGSDGITSFSQGDVQETARLADDSSFDSRDSSVRGASKCSDEYTPTPSDLEEEVSGSSEYTTDEELGGVTFKGKRRRRKRRLRDLSGDENEDNLICTDVPKRRRSLRHRGRFQDDGEEELYRMRIKYVWFL